MKKISRLSVSSGCLALSDLPRASRVTPPSVVQNIVGPLCLNRLWPFFTLRQSSQQAQALRWIAQREQTLSAGVARYEDEVRSLRQQLAEKEHLAAVGIRAASIVHEIRNPLTTLWMWLDYCQRQDLPAPARDRLSLALADGERLQRLLSQILLYAKPQALQLQAVNLIQLIAETLDVLRQTPVALNRQIEFWPSQTPVTLTADPDKLKQVLINLVTNACEAVSDGDRIRIRVEALGGDLICLQVHNGGIPISPEHLPKLTEPFYTTKATGTGLGLAIVQQIIAAHTGTLQIESSTTYGTTVAVMLPISP